MEEHNTSSLKAIRLYNSSETECAFETGIIATQIKIDVSYFFGQTKVDDYEKVPHPAPRKQYVVTLKGKLRFKVSDGSTFIVEPGIILIAEDTLGAGHSWEIIDGDQWERIYIPLNAGNDNHFTKD
ncbi:hypothetical protein SAMN06265348_10755 [Pedobacter westerhofensis]|uniref:Cupin domain-containing protein n=1 Tax=Pedobacter westerhofensis TaxID=425512 RepID=A0A521E5U1_9SPHI|nr:hypothetical protein [Pedobacter westerhofensis]SMO79314.1 hypothetical protein SAMN06265348_10755 [Pedobacter westerhofensis]